MASSVVSLIEGEKLRVWIDTLVPTKLFTVRIQHNFVLSSHLHANFVVRETFMCVEVEDENKTGSFENYNFVTFVLCADPGLQM
jgi:hypothetical protein